ncbi:PREDICTED: E3 ubiquitin-protein ligase RNF169-like [Vollenhovia emeryi]|uniref:E3 ubiquitin-protein ligase RNF169-like n=1 Tax=Vollenhovia emeryi TaxID=411798 RepID=UPI0005F3B902|nr:PREDICTED: E3 ubiquitin-protein ligase RNF169-like [Vollenhovia emeryi]
MYLKRASKLLDLTVSRTAADVHLRDLTCPICRGILIEPVTLPCTHNLCLRCLQGTFEHNSLSCPLCRVRVGSWVRAATRSETLVNHGLWELIRSKFPKEVESKHNGEEGDLGLDADYAANRILSAAGEIHREYKAQLQMAEAEMRRQRQAEQKASEALIQQIQAEDNQLLVQLAQDQLLAKSLARQQQKEAAKCYNECPSVPSYAFNEPKFNYTTVRVNNIEMPPLETARLEGRHVGLPESVRDNSKTRQMNMSLLSKMEMYSNVYGSKEANVSGAHKNPAAYCCQKQMPVYNAVAKKHQTVSKFTQPCASNYPADPGCSTSGAYAMETKEELRVPSDVVNSKKKSLGVEVCMTLADDDERIGSAESSGSHDSINQEIHHFKPIKTVPRTKLLISSDGKQVDPRLIRVIPILKKVFNAVPKPPSPTYVKRIGCSWSAFRGKIRQDAREKHAAHSLKDNAGTSIDQKPSTSFTHPQPMSNKLTTKPQTNDAIRRLNFIPEPPFDSNKNYTRNANKAINGTKVKKKLLDDEADARKTRKSWRTSVRNGMVAKSKRYRNLRSRKEARLTVTDDEDDPAGSNSSFSKPSPQTGERNGDDDVAVENIAERIKRRKENADKKTLEPEMESNASKRSRIATRKKASSERTEETPAVDRATFPTSQESAETDGSCARRAKRRKKSRSSQNTEDLERNEVSTDAAYVPRKSARNLTRISSMASESDAARNKSNSKFNYDSPPESCDETDECAPESDHTVGICVGKLLSDEEVIEEQQRIERLLLQEREDFELARRLQTQFDEMERIAGRTRRSRQVGGERSVNVNLREMNATRTVRGTGGARKAAKRKSMVGRAAGAAAKGQRGRPKRMKITVDTREDETRTR